MVTGNKKGPSVYTVLTLVPTVSSLILAGSADFFLRMSVVEACCLDRCPGEFHLQSMCHDNVTPNVRNKATTT